MRERVRHSQERARPAQCVGIGVGPMSSHGRLCRQKTRFERERVVCVCVFEQRVRKSESLLVVGKESVWKGWHRRIDQFQGQDWCQAAVGKS